MDHFLAAKFHRNFANVTAPKEYAFLTWSISNLHKCTFSRHFYPSWPKNEEKDKQFVPTIFIVHNAKFKVWSSLMQNYLEHAWKHHCSHPQQWSIMVVSVAQANTTYRTILLLWFGFSAHRSSFWTLPLQLALSSLSLFFSSALSSIKKVCSYQHNIFYFCARLFV